MAMKVSELLDILKQANPDSQVAVSLLEKPDTEELECFDISGIEEYESDDGENLVVLLADMNDEA